METAPAHLFVSFRLLAARQRHGDHMPHARTTWAMDSGGFTELQMHGTWSMNAQEYGATVVRLIADCGWPPEFVAPQDWMCEPWVMAGGSHGGIRFAGTGLTVRDHQELTVENFCYLREEFDGAGVPWMPVLQGWTLDDYLHCVDLYKAAGVDLAAEPIVGLGSVCRRQSTGEIGLIASTLAGLGLRLHGFGVKRDGLALFGEHLVSADSMAWSYSARRHDGPMPGCTHPGRCNNCLPWALRWREETLARPAQLGLQLDFPIAS